MIMKFLFRKIAIFLSPFLIIILFIIIIDPYDLINISHIIDDETKVKCLNRSLKVAPRGYTLWNILAFRRNPTSNIILGDSKFLDIDTLYVNRYLEGRCSNLSIPGASYQTLTNLFWMAAKTTKLKNVIFQTSFLSYNEMDKTPLFGTAMEIIRKPYKYFLEWNYLEDSFYVLRYSIIKNDSLVDWKKRVREDLWQRSRKWITSILTNTQYKYPHDFLPELKKIAEYCKKENINLIFVIPPNYIEYHTIIKNAGYEEKYIRFKTDIKSLGKTIDLDQGLPISNQKEYFYDYLHLKPAYQDSIIKILFSDTQVFSDESTDSLSFGS